MNKKELKFNIRKCKYERCQKEFKPPKNNPNQEYCTTECWRKSHGANK